MVGLTLTVPRKLKLGCGYKIEAIVINVYSEFNLFFPLSIYYYRIFAGYFKTTSYFATHHAGRASGTI